MSDPVRVRVTALGTGAAVGLPPRDHTSLLFELDGSPVLVDVPGSPGTKLVQAGVDPLAVGTVVVTHHHTDHCTGLPALMLHRLVRRNYDVRVAATLRCPAPGLGADGPATDLPLLRILAPPDTADFVGRMLELHDRRADASIEVVDEGQGDVAIAPGWSATPIRGDHGAMPVIGLVLRRKDGAGPTIAYSSDSRPVLAFLEAAAGADLLVHECQSASDAPPAHADADGLVAALRELADAGHALPRRLVPVHLTPWPAGEDRRVVDRLRAGCPDIEIHAASDGQVIFETPAAGGVG